MSPHNAALAQTPRRAVRARSTAASFPPIQKAPWLTAVGFLAPALLLYFGLTLYPILRTIHNSFFVLHDASTYQFVGFQNFRRAFAGDNILWWAVQHSLLWATSAPIIEAILAFLFAVTLYARVPGARLFRTVWLTPVLLSQVVVGLVWTWVYDHEWGPLNTILRSIGLGAVAHPWLGDPRTALPALVVVSIWTFAGFQMVVLLAALSSIPPSLVESAQIAGAGWWRIAWSILVPLVRPTIVNLIVLSFIIKTKIFALIWIMTSGGPLWATETVSTYVVKRAFYWQTFDLGYPSAVATLWFCAMLLVTGLIMWTTNRREHLEF